MKDFLCGSVGNTILGIILAIIVFVVLSSLFNFGGVVGGAIFGGIAGAVGFGAAAVIKNALSPTEEAAKEEKSEDS